jgi:hypothetical protein
VPGDGLSVLAFTFPRNLGCRPTTLRVRSRLLLVLWGVAVLVWIGYGFGWRKSAELDPVRMDPEFGFFVNEVDRRVHLTPLDHVEPLALVFVDPECEVCISEARRIVTIAQGFRTARTFVVPLRAFEDEAVSSLYPEELLVEPLGPEARARSGIQYVPAFVYVSGGQEELTFQGMPGPLQALIWRLGR